MSLLPQYSWSLEEYPKITPSNKNGIIVLKCSQCKQTFYRKKWYHENLMQKNSRAKVFCSPKCSLLKQHPRDETIEKIRSKQLGVSVLSRGRVGHTVSEETKEKIRLKKLGKPAPVDTAIILNELKFRKIEKSFAMVGLIPDAVFIEDGKLVALEVEKERWETGVRRKMAAYNNRPEYEKVILVWYSPEGKRLKEWQKDNGEWTLVE